MYWLPTSWRARSRGRRPYCSVYLRLYALRAKAAMISRQIQATDPDTLRLTIKENNALLYKNRSVD